jgi:D-methionine transport system permease protein
MSFDLIFKAFQESIYMIIVASALSVSFGFMLAVVLVYTNPKGLKPNPAVYKVLDFIINMFRSFPFLILMIMLFPLARLLVGKTIGTTAAIVPLFIGAIPFAARVIENAFYSVDYGIIEAAKSLGANNRQIILKVMLPEAMPNIVAGITNTVISIVGYSAMAGSIGGGGLGDIAIRYGYHRYQMDVLYVTVIILFLLVQLFQTIGNIVYRRLVR